MTFPSRQCLVVLLLGAAMVAAPRLHAQASALPSANPDAENTTPDRGRHLLDQMVHALGGEAWLHRTTWREEGKAGTFYKGTPDPYVAGFEEYHRLHPFGERIIIISRFGTFIPSDHRDVAVVWTGDNGYEVTYKGKTELKKDEVTDFVRRRKHSLDTVVTEWLQQPGVIVTYDGADIADRKLVQKVSILTATNDAVTLALDETTHLPLSLTFQYRDPLYKDINTDVEQFNDYHPYSGIQTPMTITRLHNGDIVAQRFVTKVDYDVHVPDDLFDPDRPLQKSVKK